MSNDWQTPLVVAIVAALITLAGWLATGFDPYSYLFHLMTSAF